MIYGFLLVTQQTTTDSTNTITVDIRARAKVTEVLLSYAAYAFDILYYYIP